MTSFTLTLYFTSSYISSPLSSYIAFGALLGIQLKAGRVTQLLLPPTPALR